MNISLTNIRNAENATRKADKIVLYGNAGRGKTSIPAFSESPLFIPAIGEESGIAKLAEHGLIPDTVSWLPEIDSWTGLLDAFRLLVKEEHGYKNVILECFDDEGFLSLAYRHHADEQYGGDMSHKGFLNFQNGYSTCLPTIKQVTHRAIDMLTARGINVWLIMHASVDKFKSPDTDDYHRYVPDVNQKYVWPMLRAWADMVLFLDVETYVSEGTDGRPKARGGTNRVLYCQHSACYDAKNRHGLPERIKLPDVPAAAYRTFMESLNKEANQDG